MDGLQPHPRRARRRPLWPVLHRAGQAARRAWLRYVRGQRTVTGKLSATAATASSAFGVLVVSGPEIDTDLPIEEQMRLLVHRVSSIENQASSDRKRFAKDIEAVTARVDGHAAELRAADEGIRDLARSVAVSTVKLQLWGLLLVGAGTALMAAPTLGSLWAAVI